MTGRLSAVATLAFAAMLLGGCDTLKSAATPAKASVLPVLPAPPPKRPPVVVAPAPPPRPTLAEIDSRLKLLVKLRRFHEAAQYYDANGDLVEGKSEFAPVLKQLADGLNKQYDAPLNEASASIAKLTRRKATAHELGGAQTSIDSAMQVLAEYSSIKLIRDHRLASASAKRLEQALDKARSNVAGTEAGMKAPDPRLLRLVTEKRIDAAVKLFETESSTFIAARTPGPGLLAFAQAQGAANDKALQAASADLRAHMTTSRDVATWEGASGSMKSARAALDHFEKTPPFGIASLRPQKYHAMASQLDQAERSWKARAGEAWLAYPHGSGKSFEAAYPVPVTSSELTAGWNASTEAKLSARSLAEVKALQSALSEDAPPRAKEMLARIVAQDERVVAAEKRRREVPAAKIEQAGAFKTEIASTKDAKPTAKSGPTFIDSDVN